MTYYILPCMMCTHILVLPMYNAHPYFASKIWAKVHIIDGKIQYIFMALVAVMISQVYIYPQTYRVVHIKCVPLFICQSFLNKVLLAVYIQFYNTFDDK